MQAAAESEIHLKLVAGTLFDFQCVLMALAMLHASGHVMVNASVFFSRGSVQMRSQQTGNLRCEPWKIMGKHLSFARCAAKL